MSPSLSTTVTEESVAVVEPQLKDVEVSCDEDCACEQDCPCQELGGCWSECRCACNPEPLSFNLLS